MKIKIFITIALILGFLPLIVFAQFDFDFLLDDFETDSDINLIGFDLIWSTDSYVPFGYQGRTLPSQGSQVTVEAIISVSGGDLGSLQYSWFVDGIFQENKSGSGKNIFSFSVLQHPNAYHIIKAQVFNENRSIFEEKSIKIPVVKPELVIYPSNGMPYFSARTSEVSLVLVGKQFSFIAKPYFFSIKKITDLIFEWHFASQEPVISSNYDANILGLTISGKGGEEILENDLWVSVSNKNEIRQKASQMLRIKIY